MKMKKGKSPLKENITLTQKRDAYHEAGHRVANLLLRKIKDKPVVPDGSNIFKCHCQFPFKSSYRLSRVEIEKAKKITKEKILVFFAGNEAEGLITNKRIPGEKSDWHIADDEISKLTEPGYETDELKAEAKRFVEGPQTQTIIDEVAKALLEKKTDDEIFEIIIKLRSTNV